MHKNPISIPLGFGIIGYQSYGHIQDRELEHLERHNYSPQSFLLTHPVHLILLNSLPSSYISKLWGDIVGSSEVPVWARNWLYGGWCKIFRCDVDECEFQLKDYKTLNEFFTRKLKKGCRKIEENATMISPVDAQVLHFGPVSENGLLEQVKGITYPLDSFLGINHDSWNDDSDNMDSDNNLISRVERYHADKTAIKQNLYHCILYLAPGDYHRFHSPCNAKFYNLKHFTGKLFSVSPKMARVLANLFVLNERVVMSGVWKPTQKYDCQENDRPYFFSMTAVGATNVGSISLVFEKDLRTNEFLGLTKTFSGNENASSSSNERDVTKGWFRKRIRDSHFREKVILYHGYEGENNDQMQSKVGQKISKEIAAPNAGMMHSDQVENFDTREPIHGIQFSKGDEVGQFNLGSTIVLVFEAPKNFEFCVEAGQKVHMGQTLGRLA